MATLVLCLMFWGGSRYPALSDKAAMGADTVFEDPLGFEARVFVDAADPLPKRVLLTTVNWVSTNRNGMTFGVLMAAALMTLFSLVRSTDLGGRLGNTLLGVAVGAPLGVCVNCAAPIAQGMHDSGARTETTLAAMISSPTLNIVVLTMLFSLFPPFLAITKVALTLVFILAMIPLITRFVPAAPPSARRLQALRAAIPSHSQEAGVDLPEPAQDRWIPAAGWFLRHYARNLGYIVARTVPLMFLAGLLGSLAILILPWETLVELLPSHGKILILGTLGGLSLFGLFLPVPIAFDIIVSAALLAAGMPLSYAMALLFTLGVFSVYSFMIVSNTLSFRVAGAMSVLLVGLGITGGVGAHYYELWMDRQSGLAFYEVLPRLAPGAGSRGAEPVVSTDSDPGPLPALAARAWQSSAGAIANGVESIPFEPRVGNGQKLFARHYGAELGLHAARDLPVAFKMSAPFDRSRPIASGDIHGDGWPDLVIGTESGVQLHANHNGRGFVRQSFPIPSLQGLFISLVALVDLDDDGWLDLFVATYRHGNFVAYNQAGSFHESRLQSLPDTGAPLAAGAAFGDIDQDGDLDIVLGNYSVGVWYGGGLVSSTNTLLVNQAGRFEVRGLPGAVGETMTTLLSDLDMDGDLDLFSGNDAWPTDGFFQGAAGDSFREIARSDDLIPRTTHSTMSFDSADIDNDLRPELYIGQVSGLSSSQSDRLELEELEAVCQELDGTAWRARCEDRMKKRRVFRKAIRGNDVRSCLRIQENSERGDCIALQRLRWATRGRSEPSRCDGFPGYWEPFEFICRAVYTDVVQVSEEEGRSRISQIHDRNVLLVRTEGGRYEDRADAFGLEMAGWTWNAKFADLDGDQWQDLYVANGHFFSNQRESNLFFRNRGGTGFSQETDAAGLLSHLPTVSSSYVDVDQDGDLDIVAVTVDGPIWFYRNNSQKHHTIVFELRDGRGNRFGVGSKVFIEYGPDGQKQLREIKASGGFASFDPLEAHFGLGEHDRVHRVSVHWSTGEVSEFTGEFLAGRRYRLTRPVAGQLEFGRNPARSEDLRSGRDIPGGVGHISVPAQYD